MADDKNQDGAKLPEGQHLVRLQDLPKEEQEGYLKQIVAILNARYPQGQGNENASGATQMSFEDWIRQLINKDPQKTTTVISAVVDAQGKVVAFTTMDVAPNGEAKVTHSMSADPANRNYDQALKATQEDVGKAVEAKKMHVQQTTNSVEAHAEVKQVDMYNQLHIKPHDQATIDSNALDKILQMSPKDREKLLKDVEQEIASDKNFSLANRYIEAGPVLFGYPLSQKQKDALHDNQDLNTAYRAEASYGKEMQQAGLKGEEFHRAMAEFRQTLSQNIADGNLPNIKEALDQLDKNQEANHPPHEHTR